MITRIFMMQIVKQRRLSVYGTEAGITITGGRDNNLLKSTKKLVSTLPRPYERLQDLPTFRVRADGGRV